MDFCSDFHAVAGKVRHVIKVLIPGCCNRVVNAYNLERPSQHLLLFGNAERPKKNPESLCIVRVRDRITRHPFGESSFANNVQVYGE